MAQKKSAMKTWRMKRRLFVRTDAVMHERKDVRMDG